MLGEVAVRLNIGIAADRGQDFIVVHQYSHRRAYAGLGRSRGQGARDDAARGAVLGVHGHAVVRTVPFQIDLNIAAQGGGDFVAADCHGEAARQGQLAVALGAAGHHGARDGFGVGVLSGEEVESIHRLEQLIAGQVDVHFIAVVLFALVDVNQTGVRFLALFIGQFAGIGDHILGDQVLIIRLGHGQLLRIQLEGGAGDVGIAANSGGHGIAADHVGGGDAHAHAGALGQAQAARARRQLGFVGGFHGDIATRDLALGLRAAACDVHSGCALGNQHAHRAADGHVGILPRHGAAQGLGRQLPGEDAVHILGQLAGNGNVLFLLADQVAADLNGRFVAVHADGHARRDGVGVFRHGHGRAGAHGVEVAGVLGSDLDFLVRQDLTDHRAGRVIGHGDAHRRGDLPFGAGLFAGQAHLLAGLILDLFFDALEAGAVSVHVVGRFFALGFHTQAAQHIGGGGGFAAGALAAGLLFIVQLLVDHVAGLGIGFLIVLVQIRTVEQFIGLVGQVIGLLPHLIQGTGNIRAHRGGNGVGDVLAVAGCADFRLARHCRVAHLHVHAGRGDIHGHAGAHRRRAAHGERTGGGFGDGIFLGGHGQVAVFLRVACAVALCADGVILVNHSLDAVVQNVQRHGSVHGILLGVFQIAFARQRVGARGTGNIFCMVGCGSNAQRPSGHARSALAHGGMHFGITIDHGERSADAHALACSVLGGGLGILRAVVIVKHHDECVDVGSGHVEGVHDFRGCFAALGQHHFLLVAVLVDVVVADARHLAAILLLHLYFHLVPHVGDQLVVLLLSVLHLDGDRSGLFTLGTEHVGCGDGVINRNGLELQDDILVGILDVGGIHVPTRLVILLRLYLARLFIAFLIGVGVGDFVVVREFIAVVQGEVNLGPAIRHVALTDGSGAADAHGHPYRSFFILSHGLAIVAAAHVLLRVFSGGLVLFRVALDVGRGGGGVVHGAQFLRVHGHIARYGQLAAVRDGSAGGGVQHGDGYGTGNAHVPRASASDGLGVDHMAGGLGFLGLQRQVKVFAQLAQGFVRQGDGGRLGRTAQIFGEHLLEVDLGEVFDHLLEVEHVGAEVFGHVGNGLVKDCLQLFFLESVLDVGKGLDHVLRVLHGQAGQLELSGRLLHRLAEGVADDGLDFVLRGSRNFTARFFDQLAEFIPDFSAHRAGQEVADMILHIFDHTVLHAGEDFASRAGDPVFQFAGERFLHDGHHRAAEAVRHVIHVNHSVRHGLLDRSNDVLQLIPRHGSDFAAQVEHLVQGGHERVNEQIGQGQ